MPAPFAPAARPPAVDITPFTGTHRREGVAITVSERDGEGHLVYAFVDGMAGLSPAMEMRLVPISETVFAGAGAGPFVEDWMPVVFSALQDGTGVCCIGMRAARMARRPTEFLQGTGQVARGPIDDVYGQLRHAGEGASATALAENHGRDGELTEDHSQSSSDSLSGSASGAVTE